MTADAAPRWATRRTPGRPSFGPAVGKVAAAMGCPLQAWQQLVVDVALELIEDARGRIASGGKRYRWAYRTVVIHVQRQAGKTTLVGPVNLHTCLTMPAAKTWLTAQSRQDARDTWLDVADRVTLSPLGRLVDERKSNGSEQLQAPGGGTFRVFAPTEDGLHGKANERVTVDESWAFDAAEGAMLMQAIRPTFTTTAGQLWLTSTAGTARSAWFRSYVDRGRAAVEAGSTEGIAYFEWSMPKHAADRVTQLLTDVRAAGADAAEADPVLRAKLDDAIAITLEWHPGEYAQPVAVRDAAKEMPPGEFLRAYGNVWTSTNDRVIADHTWRDCRIELAAPEPGSLALAFDVSLDRRHAAITAAWRLPDGRPAVDVIDARPGDDWLVARLDELGKRLRVPVIGCDGAGPALDIADKLRQRGWTVQALSSTDYTAACAGFLADVDARQLRHRGSGPLDDAVANAATRQLGDRWAWSRRDSAGSIAPLVGATVALWIHDHKPAPPPRPVIASRRDRAASAPTPARPQRGVLTA